MTADAQIAAVECPLLTVEGLSKSYPTARGGKLQVLHGLDLVVDRGEMITVTGESGSGKSTLLHLLGALDRPDSGTVMFDGEDVFARSDERMSEFRNSRIGFVFQFHHLLPEFDALENVIIPALIRKSNLKIARKRATELLDGMGLADRLEHRPGELSGGEKQRVAIARALMNEPDLVLADEPTGNLDEETADRLQSELVHLNRSLGQTFVIVTHNPVFAALGNRRLILESGLLTDH